MAAPLPCVYLHLLRGCVAFPFSLFFSFSLSVRSQKQTKKKKITLWQGFHPFHLSLSQVHSIIHIIHESGPSLRSRCRFFFLSRLQEGGLQIEAGHSFVSFCFFKMSDCLWVPFLQPSPQPGPLRAGLSAEEVMLLCVWL